MTRPAWDEVWLSMARDIAKRSRCDGAQIGAVIVDPTNRPISVGYNGPPKDFPVAVDSRCDSFCPRRQKDSRSLSYGLSCPSIHAEANALMFADRRDYVDGTIYVTAACCQDCTKLIANSGLARVVMVVREEDQHRDPQASIRFLEVCGLEVVVL